MDVTDGKLASRIGRLFIHWLWSASTRTAPSCNSMRRFREHWLESFEKGELKPVIDSVYSLSEAAAAHQRMEEGLNTGKIVLTM